MQWRADAVAAFAVVLGFLAVIGKRKVPAALGKGHGNGGDEGNALVGRAEQHVELHAAGFCGFGVKFSEAAK